MLWIFLILKGFSSGTEIWLFHLKFQWFQIKSVNCNVLKGYKTFSLNLEWRKYEITKVISSISVLR